MTEIGLTLGCWDYDRTRALLDGRVGVEGCRVVPVKISPEDSFPRAVSRQELDVTELLVSRRIRAVAVVDQLTVLNGPVLREIGALLRQLMRGGRVISECPLSTSDGVKAADVAWISKERLAPMERKVCFVIAPELCVEILSPSNSPAEMDEKKALYFEAGADEVWICAEDGAMAFFSAKGAAGNSALCPEFPLQVMLP